jgi:hypothetical protein
MSGVEGKAEMFPLGESITGFDPQQMWSPKIVPGLRYGAKPFSRAANR